METDLKRYYIIRVNGDDLDTYASKFSVADAIDKAGIDPSGAMLVQWAQVYSTDIGMARLKKPKVWRALEAANENS